MINTINKIAGYKINVYRSVGFLYINNKHGKEETRKSIPLKIASKVGKMALVTKPEDLNLFLQTKIVDDQDQLRQAVL